MTKNAQMTKNVLVKVKVKVKIIYNNNLLIDYYCNITRKSETTSQVILYLIFVKAYHASID